MNKNIIDQRIIDLTLGEVLEAVEARVRAILPAEGQQGKERNYVYGLKGLAKLLGCSKTTAARIKASGKYDEAFTQIGALLLIDADEVLRIAKERNNTIK